MQARISIRRAAADDAEAIAAVHTASIRGLAAKSYTSTQIAAWSAGKEPDRYRRAMAAGESMWVAEREDGTVVAFAAWQDDEVRAVYVHPAHARAGVGRRLLAAVEARARASGCEELRLEASLNAVDFYAAHGWVEGPRIARALSAGPQLECVVMTKRLS